MTKVILKRKVVELRKQGKSYSDILKIIKVSKSSLSLWLKDVPLTPTQKSGLADRRKRAVETYRATMKLKHQNKLDAYYDDQAKKLCGYRVSRASHLWREEARRKCHKGV